MAPDAEDCERGGAGCRVLPAPGEAPARAWAPCGDQGRSSSPAESRRLLAPVHAPRPRGALATGAWPAPLDYPKHPLLPSAANPKKTSFQRRKEKLLALFRPPYFILTLIAVIVCVHAWCPEEVRLLLEWSPSRWRREPWRLLSYGIVHASSTHLALNALVALTVGWSLEREQGWWRVAGVWVAGVCAGALGAGVLQPNVRVVGASAGVYALLTAHLPNVAFRFGHIPLWWFRPLSVMVLAMSEGSWALLHAPAPVLEEQQVAWAAHALGAAIGVPLAFLLFTGENQWKRPVVAARVASAALVAAATAAALFYGCCGRCQVRA